MLSSLGALFTSGRTHSSGATELRLGKYSCGLLKDHSISSTLQLGNCARSSVYSDLSAIPLCYNLRLLLEFRRPEGWDSIPTGSHPKRSNASSVHYVLVVRTDRWMELICGLRRGFVHRRGMHMHMQQTEHSEPRCVWVRISLYELYYIVHVVLYLTENRRRSGVLNRSLFDG